MLVGEIIDAINKKEKTIKQIAEEYSRSDRTIQGKIKLLGFKWNPKDMQYEYIGEDLEATRQQDFKELFDASQPRQKKQVSRNPSQPSEAAPVKKKGYDRIDMLLADQQAANKGRKYYGFYADDDVLAVIQKVKAGNKSELINEVLRQTFKDRGLL